MKRSSAILLILLFSTAMVSVSVPVLQAQEVFQYRHKVGQRFRIEGHVDESIYRNNVLVKTVRFKNIGDLRVSRVVGDKALHEGNFATYRSDTVPDDFALEREYQTAFFRDRYGNIDISDA